MASQTVTTLIDDLSGEPGDDIQPVTFAFNGVLFEIDLSAENRNVFELTLSEYIENARVVEEEKPVKAKGVAKKAKTNEAAQIREWAKANGVAVNERGRISAEVREAYETAVLAEAAKQMHPATV